MPSLIIRPSSLDSITGFNASSALSLAILSDADLTTKITQNDPSANLTGLGFAVPLLQPGTTFNSFTIDIVALAGRTGTSNVTVIVDDASGTQIVSTNHTFNLTAPHQSHAFSGNGSTTASATLINNMDIKIIPDSAGISIFEVTLVADISLPPPVDDKSLSLFEGKIFIHEGKVIL